jgi:GrpB-like predicted nucleotidyltransferase (UPF0157 family)
MDEIELVEYDPRWPARFEDEAARVRAVLDPALIVGIEHFGSTAIPGMAAKPIIDILIAVRSLQEARLTTVEPLRTLDYIYWSDNPATDRMFFVKGMPPYGTGRTHHVHIVEPTAEPWLNLPFRDHLKSHPEDAERYAALKRKLATLYRFDREGYTAGKAAFIREILAKTNSGSDADPA